MVPGVKRVTGAPVDAEEPEPDDALEPEDVPDCPDDPP